MRGEAVDWFLMAVEDLKMARDAFEKGRLNWALFACHQACEKALKAGLIASRRRPPRTHDLVELVELLGVDLDEETVSGLSELSPYYTIARYPNAGLRRPWAEIGREFAERMIALSEKLLETVDERFGLRE
ncbi:MAG: HEPN domain-containing protein [Candidatus Caldarchaeum sp.]|nr:HEPN domain-containing protein [Candidatus Caldarchaeum sp.]